MPPALTIVTATRAYAVIDKPHGLRTVPGRDPDATDFVETRAREAFPDATGPLIVHRLDIETSGLLVVGLTRPAHRRLSKQFMDRKVGKTYTAVLDGVLEVDEGAVDLPLRVDWSNRPRQIVCHDEGRPSRTLYRVTERTETTTRVSFRPATGRTHQLRVHAATPREQGGLGCPILGDTLYGDASKAPRLLLHADHLAFWEPGEHEWVKYTSAPPF